MSLGFLLVNGTLIVLYAGYCWGVWGRNSLLLQYLFQCKCPVNSEQARYPDNIEIIIPACQYYLSILSPSGRLLYVEEKSNNGIPSAYLLDLQANKKSILKLDVESEYFLTDELIFHSFYGDNEYIFDIENEKKYPIQRFTNLHADAYINNELNLKALVEELQKTKDVFLIDNDMIVALAMDLQARPESNFIVRRVEFSGRESDRVENFLQQNNIAYHYVLDMFPGEVLSPDGKFIAREDGIYLIATGEKIVEGYSVSGYYRPYSGQYFSVRGWLYDNSGVLYSAFFEPCLLETNFVIFEYPTCIVKVDQPLIKLKVPPEYLD